MEDGIQMDPVGVTETAPELTGDDAVLMGLLDDANSGEDESLAAHSFLDKVGDTHDEDSADSEETPSEQAEASPEETGEPETDNVQEDGIDQSLKAALKLDGLPDDLIDLMVKTDRDKAIAYALGRQKNQRDVNQAFQERAELQKDADAEPGSEEDAGKPAQPASASLEAMAQPLIEELGEDAAGAVVKMIQAALQPVTERMQASETAQADARAQQENVALASARHGLEERFPQIKDATAYASLVKRVERMAPGYADNEGSLEDVVRELMTDASILEFGDAPAKPPRKQSRNQMTSPNRKTPSRAKSKDEQEMDILTQLEQKHGVG